MDCPEPEQAGTATARPSVLEEDAASGVVYRIMGPADARAVVDVVARAFLQGEPVTGAGRCTLKDWLAFCEMYVPRMAQEGNSVVAEDSTSSKLLGAFINEDYNNPDPAELKEFLAKSEGDWMPVMTMIGKLEESFNEEHRVPAEPKDRPQGTHFHLWMIGVAPEARKRKVGSKLTEHSLAWAKKQGFETAFAECTGAHSTAILRKVGASTQSFIPYAESDNEDVRKVVEQGHEGMSMMVLKLK